MNIKSSVSTILDKNRTGKHRVERPHATFDEAEIGNGRLVPSQFSPLQACEANPRRKLFKIKAFTLIELLIVIAIVGILSALLLPALKTAKDTAKTIACANNLKQNNLAYLNYAYENNEWTVYDSFELRWENPLVKLNYLPNSYHSETLNNWGWFLSNTMLCPALPEPIAMSSSKPLAYRSDYGLNYLTCHAWNSSLGKYTSGKLQKIIPQAVILGDRYNYPKAEQTPQKGPNPLINPYYSVSYILGIHHSNGANLSFMDAHVEFVKKNAELQHPEWWEKYK